ncbi:type VI secretion system tube protein Hcp [bacterium AH-315-E07]|nr:type VI secretion system tube protein Hcp [bacterium AH-315-E07]
MTDLITTKHIDSSTPNLFIESYYGKGKTVKLHLTKMGSGGGLDVYMEFTLKNALIDKLELAEADNFHLNDLGPIVTEITDFMPQAENCAA